MAMRVPLLVADLPALTEITGAGARGQAFTAGDPGALAAAAARLMDNEPERKQMADAAALWVATERSWSAVAEAFEAAYDELLATRPGRHEALASTHGSTAC
jgi:phosphatidyl-myo-inositol dimannoside synthase